MSSLPSRRWLALPLFCIVILTFQNCGQHLVVGEADLGSISVQSMSEDEVASAIARYPDEDPNAGLELRSTADIDIKRSVLITDRRVLDRMQDQLDFAVKVAEFYDYTRDVIAKERPGSDPKAKTPGEFLARIFDNAYEEQLEHKKLPADRRIADVPNDDRYMNRIFSVWKSASELEKIKSKSGLRGSPFRLLAIANLMDQAGNIDDRGTTDATQNARALGELHLVYGFVDKNYERNGRAYPQTFVLSYRLPVLEWKDGRLESLRPNADVNMHSLMKDPNAWSWRLKWWARQWARLSDVRMSSDEYEARLARILQLAIQPENFMNIRSNTKINERSFELREWYLLNTNLQLIPRKPRGEPYRCLSGGKLLNKFVNSFWRADMKDVDVFAYKRPAEGNARKNDNGYVVYRDINVPFFENLTNADGVTMKGGVAKAFDGCGQGPNTMPFEMWSDVQEDQSPRFTAPFASFKNEGEIWKLTAGAPEERRHAFAIRTCSGCHSQEGAAKGFHIAPRLAGEDAKLSPFLTGNGANTFTHGGVTYRYSQLADRRKHMFRAFERRAELYEGLRRVDTD